MYGNGRIYIDTTVTPNKGISIGDIQAVLGSHLIDIGGLIAGGGVNKWAKYKPTRAAGVNPADWWKGPVKTIYGGTQGYSCGLSVLVCSSLMDLKNAMDAGAVGWEYEQPRGGIDRFRFLDFDGYYHGAVSPFHRVGLDGESYPSGSTQPIHLYADFSGLDPGELGVSDFTIISNWYFGFALYRNGGLYGVGTSEMKIGTETDASRLVLCVLPAGANGTYDLYPFFSYESRAWSRTNPFTIERFVPLPIGRGGITVYPDLAEIWAEGTIAGSGPASSRGIDYSITLKAKHAAPTSFGTLIIECYKYAFPNWELVHTVTGIQAGAIAAGDTATLSGTILRRDFADTGDYDYMYDNGGRIIVRSSDADIAPATADLARDVN